MARSAVALVGLVAFFALLLAAVPGRADSIMVNVHTANWLNAWIAAIPNLKIIWLNPNICARSGIECNAETNTLSIHLDSVTSAGFNFIGTLPEVADAINGNLVQVTSVSVKGKPRITGTIPASWSRLSKLTLLDLSQTKLSGQIPDALGSLANLVTADFSNSYFCYGMPNWNATGMPSLTSALFKNNNMRGTFASSWSTFSSSLSLDISGNKLCGCMPPSWTSSNLVSAAKAMNPASVSGCTQVCTADSLNYCPLPNIKPSAAAAQAATLSAVFVALAATIVSFV
ncbi:surface antigen-like protein [Leptomonas pyrrhocoris]|uniref:Surface antigen-like protein n=1 Tax=Leptomonas pyrrhocoris TaxID=157538 RepID=A0A0M9FPI1_LEPPY|nr:surface antigen-like protein [Leptomonas pyrrhocoris]XP_015651806.1 surface antigen-like protein [Leptomonas pyrrhocoris]KPA73366.1 surface antigen-like protein [Leptomonas pyrrhocoris]KPA73367.1 surface antigen-like protein [Leptomonas pyrrhocoris]|eukprot:XP_015651805.1 surface antigen-like protein [Leptomonas pyrrhocoris]